MKIKRLLPLPFQEKVEGCEKPQMHYFHPPNVTNNFYLWNIVVRLSENYVHKLWDIFDRSLQPKTSLQKNTKSNS